MSEERIRSVFDDNSEIILFIPSSKPMLWVHMMNLTVKQFNQKKYHNESKIRSSQKQCVKTPGDPSGVK